MIEKKCIACNDVFEGRADKIYCTPYCKSNYHYQLNKEKEASVFVRVERQIKLNRRLLKHFNKSGKSTIRIEKLHAAGFNPDFFTHIWRNKENKVYRFCYDVGFLDILEGKKKKYLLIDFQEQYMGGI